MGRQGLCAGLEPAPVLAVPEHLLETRRPVFADAAGPGRRTQPFDADAYVAGFRVRKCNTTSSEYLQDLLAGES
jgi:hypothetical protein